ncbi:MAG: Type secretion system protein [Verrucomicrobiota bacterium]|jgi:type II secretion system protein J
MQIAIHNPNMVTVRLKRIEARAFTLLEVLLALLILAMVLAVVHAIFHGAITLRNQADQKFEESIPLQHAVSLIKRDFANITVPGGTLSGMFQTTLTTGSSSTTAAHAGQQVGPVIYTASGTLSDTDTWSEMRKVTYYLVPSTNLGSGLDLVRSTVRNLLPVTQDDYSDQRLLGGVDNVTFQYYNGTQWMDTWDSTATSSTSSTTNNLPTGVRIQIAMAAETGKMAPDPIELVVPISVQISTNSASTTGGSQ